MIKALKVVMIVWAIILILTGLGFIFIPQQLIEMTGMPKPSGSGLYDLTLLSVSWIVLSVFVIIAARDPLKNIMWVRLAIALAVLFFITDVYSLLRGFLNFSQGGMMLILDTVFAILFLIFYPWRAGH